MPKYKLVVTTAFKRDYKKLVKRKYNLDLLTKIVNSLLNGEKLPLKNKDHALTGNWNGYRECHIEPDWLLIWEQYEEELLMLMINTGSHSDLFGKK